MQRSEGRSIGERLSEYIQFMKHLPKDLLEAEESRLIEIVEEALDIKEMLVKIGIDFRNLTQLNDGKLISRLSSKLGQSLMIVAPPVNKCLQCQRKLTLNHNKQTQVALFTLQGPKMCSKYIYRCLLCPLREKTENDNNAGASDRQDVFYHP